MSEKIDDYYLIHGRTDNRDYATGNFVLYKLKMAQTGIAVYFSTGVEGVAGPGSNAYSVNEVIGKYDPSL